MPKDEWAGGARGRYIHVRPCGISVFTAEQRMYLHSLDTSLSPATTTTARKRRSPVDLSLATTYVPGFYCLLRGTVLVLAIIKYPLSVPTLMVLCMFLYVDRSVRRESIFDGNAVLCAILAAHILNVFRSDPENHQLFLAAPFDTTAASAATPPAVGGGDAVRIWGRLAQGLLTATSASLLMGLDIASMAVRGLAPPLAQAQNQSAMGAVWGTSARVSTVVANAVLLTCVLQTPIDRALVVSTVHIVARCYTFLGACLLWTYAAGVQEMVGLLTSTVRIPPLLLHQSQSSHAAAGKGNRSRHVSALSVVQSFMPCHLRFTYLLLASGNHLIVAGCATGCILAWIVYRASNGQRAAPLGAPQPQQNRRPLPTPPAGSFTHPEYCIEEGRPLCGDTVPALFAGYPPPPACPGDPIGMSMAQAPIYPVPDDVCDDDEDGADDDHCYENGGCSDDESPDLPLEDWGHRDADAAQNHSIQWSSPQGSALPPPPPPQKQDEAAASAAAHLAPTQVPPPSTYHVHWQASQQQGNHGGGGLRRRDHTTTTADGFSPEQQQQQPETGGGCDENLQGAREGEEEEDEDEVAAMFRRAKQARGTLGGPSSSSVISF